MKLSELEGDNGGVCDVTFLVFFMGDITRNLTETCFSRIYLGTFSKCLTKCESLFSTGRYWFLSFSLKPAMFVSVTFYCLLSSVLS